MAYQHQAVSELNPEAMNFRFVDLTCGSTFYIQTQRQREIERDYFQETDQSDLKKSDTRNNNVDQNLKMM